MTRLRFALGDTVAYAEQRFPDVVWHADYRVTSILPADEHGPRYSIQCHAPVFDRVVREHELSPVLAGGPSGGGARRPRLRSLHAVLSQAKYQGRCAAVLQPGEGEH